jgi:hypothetical protein
MRHPANVSFKQEKIIQMPANRLSAYNEVVEFPLRHIEAIFQIWNREQLFYAFPRESHGHDGLDHVCNAFFVF